MPYPKPLNPNALQNEAVAKSSLCGTVPQNPNPYLEMLHEHVNHKYLQPVNEIHLLHQ